MQRATRKSLLALSLILLPVAGGSATAAAAQQWSAVFGGGSPDFGSGVAPTDDGGAVAVGSTEWLNAYAVRVDGSGQLVWQRTLSLSSSSEQAFSALPTGDGGVVVIASANLPGTPDYRPWLLQLDAGGNTVWSTEGTITASLPVDSGLVRGARLASGDIVVAGGSNSFTDVQDPWVLIVGPDGQQLAFDVYPTLGTPGFGVATYVNDVRATGDGGFVLTGSVSGGLGFAYLWKFDALGEPEWNRLYSAEGFRAAESVLPLADGYLAVGCDLPNCNHTTALRTDAAGEPLWTRTYVDPEGQQSVGRDALARADGNLLVLQNRYAAAGSRTFLTDLLELAPDGSLVSRRPIPGGAASTALWRLAAAAGNSFVATGSLRDTSDPSEIDLYLLRDGDGTTRLFGDGFESGDLGAWSGTAGD